MNLDMSLKTQKWLVIGLISALVIFVNVNFILLPKSQKVVEAFNESRSNDNEIKELRAKVGKVEEFEAEKKFIKYQLADLNSKLPNYLIPENFVLNFKNLISARGIEVKSMSFSNALEFAAPDVQPSYKPSEPLSVRADEFIRRLFESNDAKGVRATQAEFQYGGIGEEKPIKVDFKFDFTGEDQQVMDLIRVLEASTERVKINTISINSGRGSTLTGSMDITFFGFKDSKIPKYDLWAKDIPRGKGSLFTSLESTRSLFADVDGSDFNISLNPVTFDSPSVIVAKQGLQGSSVYGENKGVEEIEIHVREDNGKFYYKYKTRSRSYPISYKFAEFTPLTSTDIVVKVYSRFRVSPDDASGAHLTVYNSTGRRLKVVAYDDDPDKPRFSYDEKK